MGLVPTAETLEITGAALMRALEVVDRDHACHCRLGESPGGCSNRMCYLVRGMARADRASWLGTAMDPIHTRCVIVRVRWHDERGDEQPTITALPPLTGPMVADPRSTRATLGRWGEE